MFEEDFFCVIHPRFYIWDKILSNSSLHTHSHIFALNPFLFVCQMHNFSPFLHFFIYMWKAHKTCFPNISFNLYPLFLWAVKAPFFLHSYWDFAQFKKQFFVHLTNDAKRADRWRIALNCTSNWRFLFKRSASDKVARKFKYPW